MIQMSFFLILGRCAFIYLILQLKFVFLDSSRAGQALALLPGWAPLMKYEAVLLVSSGFRVKKRLKNLPACIFLISIQLRLSIGMFMPRN